MRLGDACLNREPIGRFRAAPETDAGGRLHGRAGHDGQTRAAAAEMRPYSAAELKAAVLAKLTYAVGKTPAARHAARLVSGGHVRHPRHHRRPLAGIAERRLCRRAQARLLSLARIPDRAPAVRRPDQSRRRATDGGGARRARRQSDGLAPDRARRGARQRRPRPPRRMFHGQHGDACRSPRTATASATTTACFARLFAAAGSRKRRRTGSSTAIRGSSSVPNTITRLGSAVGSKWSRTTSAPATSGIRLRRWKRSPTIRQSSAGAAGM